MKYFSAFLILALASVMIHGQNSSPNNVPAFHAAVPEKGGALPPILTQEQLAQAGATMPAQKAAYKAAVKSGSLLYQMPCYCYCDRHAGHTSLRSCFESMHGANCGTCISEALYSYEQSKKGWSAKMIRDGIIRGDFKMVDLQNPPPVN